MIALLGALQAEMYHTVRRIEKSEQLEWAGRKITLGTLAGQQVVCTWTGSGIAHSALTSQYICSRFQPKALLLAGIGAAINPMYQLWDTVIAGDVIQWNIDTSAIGGGLGVFPGLQPDNSQLREIRTDPKLGKRLRESAEKQSEHSPENFAVSTGRVLSGDHFLPIEGGRKLRARLRKDFQGDLVDMESSSVVLAGFQNKIACAVLRIVSDTVAGERPENFRSFLDGCSIRSAAVLETFLGSLYNEPL
ncbi:MAG TPA: 5'-methylthioadenosine/S-adenosylhomocysteine nucleosidase [Clostridia bacterium]|nr:5'-methylthioadenosine/S-adenosylhomocysteine nucleosidase [Clostridia bacterium]